MSWVKLDDHFPDNPKIAPLSDRAFVAYVTSVCYCARELTDGFIATKTARMYAGKASAIKELTPHLWEPCEGGYRVHDFLVYNPSREKVLATKQAHSEAGSKGAANRWHGDDNDDGKPDGKSHGPYPVPESPSSLPLPDLPPPAPNEAVAVKEFWEGRIGPLSPKEVTELASWTRKVGEEWVYEAIEEAEDRAEQPWPYFVGTLTRCLTDGRSPKGKRRPKAKSTPRSVSEVLKQKQTTRRT